MTNLCPPGPNAIGSDAVGVPAQHDKLAVRYEAVLVIASINEWIP